jgi:hypothetical protein
MINTMSRAELAVKLQNDLMDQYLTEGDCHIDDVMLFEDLLDSFTGIEFLAYTAMNEISLN